MKTMDPKEILQKEYDNNVPYPYSFWISSAIVQGEHDLAYHFLEKNSDKKGIRTDEVMMINELLIQFKSC